MRQKAALIGRVTEEGFDVVYEHVPLGKLYYVDLNSVETMTVGNRNHPGVLVKKLMIQAYDRPEGGPGGWMPVELLKIEANA